MRSLGIAVLAVAGVSVVGCDGEDPTRRLETTFDTVAGTIHVVHRGGRADDRLEPVLEIGAVGGLADAPSPEEFGRIARVVGDADGRVYVSDQIPPEIRIFGPDGSHLGTVGREGAGPGELGGLYGAVWLAPDTLLVVDPGNARLAVLTTKGEQVRQWGWARLSGRARLFLFNGGPREAYGYVLVPGRRDGERLGSVWVRYTLHAPPDTLEIPTAERLGVDLPANLELCRNDVGLGSLSNPYAPSLIRAPAPDLERAVALSPEYRIAFIDRGGDTVRVISRDVSPVPLPDSARSALEAERAEFRARWRGADCEGEIASTDVLPVLRDLYFDHHGRLLVEYNRPEGVTFDLFDREGRWIGTFPAPDRDRSVPPYLRGQRLYTVTRDSLDIQRVRVHRLVAPEG